MKNRALYVREVGAVSGLGWSWSETWSRLLSGETRLAKFSDCGFGAEVRVNVSVVPGLNRCMENRGGIEGAGTRLARAALAECFKKDDPTVDRIGFYGGSNHGETDIVLELARTLGDSPEFQRALWDAVLNDPLPSVPAIFHMARLDPRAWCYSACASSLHALACAQMDLLDGEYNNALVLGVDPMSLLCVAGFVRAGAAAASGCAPFRENRAGILIGEGASALRLSVEPSECDPEVKLLGLAMTCDAAHPTQPDPQGKQLERALRQSLERAGLGAANARAVICHGTGTVANDIVEAEVCRRLWPRADVPITSIKGGLGHCMGAAGLFNCLAAVETCRTGWIPPSLGTAAPLPDLDLVTSARQVPPGGPVITLASGFGGNHVAVVFGSS